MTITLPLRISFKDWVGDLNHSLPHMSVPVVSKEGSKDWWSWAALFVNANNLNGITVPDKKFFPEEEDWREWALFLTRSSTL